MKKSTIIKYLELQQEKEMAYKGKTQEAAALKAQRDAEIDDDKYDQLDKDILFCYQERDCYREELEVIEGKLKTTRREDRKGFLEAVAAYSETVPEPTETIQMIRTTGQSAAQERLERIYSTY